MMRLDKRLSVLFARSGVSKRDYPAVGLGAERVALSISERRQSQALMRVNHAGEVSAQALYKAQALTARDEGVLQAMRQSAIEEFDHLIWCRRRLSELGGRTSRLDAGWFLGAFSIGTLAGLCGDRWSLAFVAETERQVVVHLARHLDQISAKDLRSQAVLRQMQQDEARHASHAYAAGAIELPVSVKKMMGLCARVMTSTAYYF
jgi:ubiquinone biosynthesis monooxygenase Coq7